MSGNVREYAACCLGLMARSSRISRVGDLESLETVVVDTIELLLGTSHSSSSDGGDSGSDQSEQHSERHDRNKKDKKDKHKDKHKDKKNTRRKNGGKEEAPFTAKNALRIMHAFCVVVWSECSSDAADNTGTTTTTVDWKMSIVQQIIDLALQYITSSNVVPLQVDGVGLLGVALGAKSQLLVRHARAMDLIGMQHHKNIASLNAKLLLMLNVCYEEEERVRTTANQHVHGSIPGIRATCEKVVVAYIGRLLSLVGEDSGIMAQINAEGHLQRAVLRLLFHPPVVVVKEEKEEEEQKGNNQNKHSSSNYNNYKKNDSSKNSKSSKDGKDGKGKAMHVSFDLKRRRVDASTFQWCSYILMQLSKRESSAVFISTTAREAAMLLDLLITPTHAPRATSNCTTGSASSDAAVQQNDFTTWCLAFSMMNRLWSSVEQRQIFTLLQAPAVLVQLLTFSVSR
jgi:hypothetical protein